MHDYFDQPSDAARFLIDDAGDKKYSVAGSKYVLISCNNSFKGMKKVILFHLILPYVCL